MKNSKVVDMAAMKEEEKKAGKRAEARQRRKERLAAIDVDSLPEVITVDEVAALLRVDPKTVREHFHQGTLPGGRKIGAKVIRFHRDTVLDWMRG
jgi:excisionase family DNA binding protein